MAYDPKEDIWWADKLEGKAPPIHNDTPMRGFYAYQPSGKKIAPKPVAFWYGGDGLLRCKIDNQPVKYGLDIWPACAKSPITYEVYTSVIAGNPWPSEVRVTKEDGTVDSTLSDSPGSNRAVPGHNSGDYLTTARDNIKEWEDRLRKALKKGTPQTQVDADALADIVTKLNDLATEANAEREKVTGPLWRAFKEENAKWEFLKAVPTLVANGKALGAQYIQAENRRRQKAADEANAKIEAERRAEEAKNPRPAESLDTTPAPSQPVVHAQPVTIGTRKTIAITNTKDVEFDADGGLAKAAAYFCGLEPPNEAIRAAVVTAAKAAMKLNIPIPGVKQVNKEKAR